MPETDRSPMFDFDLSGLVEWSGLGARYWYGKVKDVDHYKVGKRLFFKRAGVEKFLESHRITRVSQG